MNIPFLQARHYRRGPRSRVDLVVIHSAETPETSRGAEQLMRYCATSERVASWHYAVDDDGVTQSVREEDIAFHAPGANSNGIGIELTGRASQDGAGWDDEFSRKVLANAAALTRAVCERWDVPVRFVDSAGLLAGQRGITTHAMVSEAFRKSDHTDPGVGFPLQRFLEAVQGMPFAPVPSSRPTVPLGAARPRLARGARGTAVVELQRRLNLAAPSPALRADGDFGALTEDAVRGFQRAQALAETGVAEEAVWASLPALLA